MFKAQGIGPFSAYSDDPARFSNRGNAFALGYGAKIGYFGQVTPRFSIGAYWQSRTYSQSFGRYAGLFAGNGGFDIPSTYGGGVAFKVTDNLDLAADVRVINFSGIPAVGNQLGLLFTGHPFGSVNGPGFGWRNVTAVKIGANYRLNAAWEVRAGWDHASNPIPRSQTFLNILAPAVVQDQFTAGATWTRRSGFEVTAYILEAPKQTVRGAGSIPVSLGGGNANVSLSETAVGIGFGWKH
jgi:long-chain fatty acid transport protein